MKIKAGISAGQVLQRVGRRAEARVSICGESCHDGEVSVTVHSSAGPVAGWNKRKSGYSRGGQFRFVLEGIPVGGPYRFVIECGGERKTIEPVFVGDVWILAGQSNMQGVGNLDGAAKPHPLIRALTLRREWRLAKDPLHVTQESPDACHNGGMQCSREIAELLRRGTKGTGVGIFFAREMINREGVPQGLLCTAQGSTKMIQWDPAYKLTDGISLYASMLASVAATAQPVAGVLWYQGESDANAEDAPLYSRRMERLVRVLRRDLRQPGLPWVVVQLARKYGDLKIGADCWNSIQDQQRLLPTRIRSLETVAAVDLPMDDHIHIGAAGFPSLGLRMAAAMHSMQGRGGTTRMPPPRLHKIRHPKNQAPGLQTVEIEFRNIRGSLIASGEPSGFAVVDESGLERPFIFRTTLHGNTVRLHLSGGMEIETLRAGYGVGFHPVCNITDERKFSIPAFQPVRLGHSMTWLPFVTQWALTRVMPAVKPLRSLTLDDLQMARYELKSRPPGPDGFVNENLRWQGCSGITFFSTAICLPESMRLEFLMGYDGPFALWVGANRFYLDEKGVTPARPDSFRKATTLAAGRHDLRIAMDVNNGAAWGFFLRFRRLDITRKQIASRDYARPDYLLPC